ncbi:MAG: BREX system Lon protease-like protein BrxL [Kiritimatiellae bacterium]|nr:BREX system Lon protease-like protein BrxL [Kiritimatiellia bacterium]
MTMDHLDEVAVKALDGYLVRKDLVRKFSKQFPVPTYVVEFLLGRYCASTDEAEIAEGLELVQKSLQNKAVSNGNEELFKAHAREKGKIKIIDLVTAKLDSRRDVYVARLPSLQLEDVRISRDLVMANERMLTGGFYAEVTLEYDKAMTDQHMNPFGIAEMREIQLSKADVMKTLCEARKAFTTEEWKAFLLRCAGYEPTALSERERDALLLRMVPLVERNYNMVEIGPRGTGKSHLFQQITPYARLISGGKPTVAQLFVNNSTGQRGLVCHYDVVCFDEITGISFKEKEGVNIMKGYMESGEFSRGRESIRGDGGIVMVGNFDVDMEHQRKIGHLLKPLPPEMRDDTAFMDRIHAYIPGWDVPKFDPKKNLTDHFGLVSDFISECWHQLRNGSRVSVLHGRVKFGSALSGRDSGAVSKTVSGLLKLISPDPAAEVSDEDLEWALRLAMDVRCRVKEQQKTIGYEEYRKTKFSYFLGESGEEKFVTTPEGGHGDEPPPDDLIEAEAEIQAAKMMLTGAGKSKTDVPGSVKNEPAKEEIASTNANSGTIVIKVTDGPVAVDSGPKSGHFTFAEGDTGISYDHLFGDYLKGAKKIVVVDPYIRSFRQERNFMEFMETVFWNRIGNEKVEVVLETVKSDFNSDAQIENFEKIRDAFAPEGIDFSWNFPTEKIHARSIRTDTGWKISLDRGLDIFDPSYSSDISDAFSLRNRIQSRRPVLAFEVTYMKQS